MQKPTTSRQNPPPNETGKINAGYGTNLEETSHLLMPSSYHRLQVSETLFRQDPPCNLQKYW